MYLMNWYILTVSLTLMWIIWKHYANWRSFWSLRSFWRRAKMSEQCKISEFPSNFVKKYPKGPFCVMQLKCKYPCQVSISYHPWEWTWMKNIQLESFSIWPKSTIMKSTAFTCNGMYKPVPEHSGSWQTQWKTQHHRRPHQLFYSYL